MIRDTASLAVFLKSICPRSRNPTGRKVRSIDRGLMILMILYRCDPVVLVTVA